MVKVIIAFTSMTGNTEMMANAIAEGIQSQNIQIEMRDIMEISPSDVLNYDGIILGSYTWGDGELPDEFLDFYEAMHGLDLSTKKVTVFGSCSSMYEYYGRAVDLLIDKLKDCHADIICEPLKIDMMPSEEEEKLCFHFGENFGECIAKI